MNRVFNTKNVSSLSSAVNTINIIAQSAQNNQNVSRETFLTDTEEDETFLVAGTNGRII